MAETDAQILGEGFPWRTWTRLPTLLRPQFDAGQLTLAVG